VEQKVSALDLIKAVAPIVGGSGGGKAGSAQAGGKEPSKISEALSQAKQFLRK
jgi:alanyl-tRNA synthetase